MESVKPKSFEDILKDIQKKLGSPEMYRASFVEDEIRFNFGSDFLKKYQVTARPYKFIGHDTGSFENERKGDKEPDEGQKERYKDSTNQQLNLPSSSTIQAAAYWPERQYLVVSFKSGHTYSYDKVQLDTVQKWENASSAGSYFYYNIRMSYAYKKLG